MGSAMQSVYPFILHLTEICCTYKSLGFVPQNLGELKTPQIGALKGLDSNYTRNKKSSVITSQLIECCAQTFKCTYSFSKHTRTLRHKKNTECLTCRQQFTTSNDLNQHKALVHGLTGFHCEDCSAIYEDRNLLERHVDYAHKQPIYKCTLCSFKSRSVPILRNHFSIIHSRDKFQESISIKQEGPFECCGKYFNYLSHYQRHLSSLQHFNQHRCGICHEIFESGEALDQHKKLVHFFTGSKWACPMCEKTFTTKGIFNSHLKSRHIKATTYECTKCQYVSTSKFTLSRHMKFKHGPDGAVLKHSCQICQRQFGRKDHLSAHLQIHRKDSLPMFKCSKCSYATYNKYVLSRHLKSVHNLESKSYKCSRCPRWFHRKDGFKRHMQTHERNIHYCSVCSVVFASAAHLEEHKPVHRPCQVCGLVVRGRKRDRDKHNKTHLV